MSPFRSSQPFARHARGALAWLLAGVVLTLSLLTASPTLHERLHAHDHAVAHGDDDGCAITLFGHGVTTPPSPPCIAAPEVRWVVTPPPSHETLPPVAAPGLHPPGRGPPCIG